ncbi:MAG: 2-amino-4-hydroxy-6-hydroxymethyldihydropteridine diphosphokinase [Actinomycetota bacterium]|nr:2-amino-4-hydroxy-6-hydroxymethyldihydropteridine diphosphokinase [Actinomycetota bacterium]
MNNSKVFVGLGSNMGDRLENIRFALMELANHPEIDVIKSSEVYESEPVGYTAQPFFFNAVLELETKLDPWELLDFTQELENLAGRERTFRWGPRSLDIDILFFGDLVLKEPRLVIPHPEIARRRFVLEPLVEIWRDARFPDGRLVSEALEDVSLDQVVWRVGDL